jgi:phosphoribosylformylglycinamidine synthase
MKKPVIAIVTFPGNNCEVESMRMVKANGMDPLYFRWNDDRTKLKGVDGYFLPGGFAYEDRGRSGMVAGRDSLLDFIGQESESGKVVIGNCNGAQVLVESGLIPLGHHLNMSLARNAIQTASGFESPGFLSEWVWMKVACAKDKCATSNWEGPMHVPIAHGEGRFTTKDADLYKELKKNDQIAFVYCDKDGNVSEDAEVTPNGSMHAIAGICNPAGNVIAIMPHPERTENGHPYFESLRIWIESGKSGKVIKTTKQSESTFNIPERAPRSIELFIDTIIVNNEERTVEQTAKKFAPNIRLKQWKYLSLSESDLQKALKDLTIFNPHKERAFIRRHGKLMRWNSEAKKEDTSESNVLTGTLLLRRDIPDTGASSFGGKSETGVCYACSEISEHELMKPKVLEVFANPHASTLQKLS